jgi:hypothetical protein
MTPSDCLPAGSNFFVSTLAAVTALVWGDSLKVRATKPRGSLAQTTRDTERTPTAPAPPRAAAPRPLAMLDD